MPLNPCLWAWFLTECLRGFISAKMHRQNHVFKNTQPHNSIKAESIHVYMHVKHIQELSNRNIYLCYWQRWAIKQCAIVCVKPTSSQQMWVDLRGKLPTCATTWYAYIKKIHSTWKKWKKKNGFLCSISKGDCFLVLFLLLEKNQ